jgi:hypothetical protein
MKYNYTFNVLRFLVLLVAFGLLSSARLNAQGLSTNRTYIVNGAADLVAPVDTFANLTGPIIGPTYGALTFLNQFGMNASQTGTGQVVFLLSAGYNPVEPTAINIGSAIGAGGWPNMFWNANSPIVIKPADGQNFTITTTALIGANQSLVRFNGAWFASIDGEGTVGQRNLTFFMPATATQATSRVVDFMPTSGQRVQSVGIRNCNIIGHSTALANSTFAGVYLGGVNAATPAALGQNQNIDVVNNYILGVQNGVYFRGLANAVNLQNRNINISNNIIGDFTNTFRTGTTANTGAANANGIYLNAVSNAVVSGNTISNAIAASANYKGIFLTNEGGGAGLSLDSNIQVINNRIYNLNITASGGVTGIRINLGAHTQHLRLLLANNMISRISATAAQAALNGFAYPVGILVENNSANIGLEVFHNSINLTGSSLPANSFSACFATGPGVTGGIIMMNNSYANSMGRLTSNLTTYTVYNVLTTNPTVTPFTYSSFNNYFTTTYDGGNAFMGRLRNVDYTSLKGYRMNHLSDSTSYSTIPPFRNDSDLTVNNGVSHWTFNTGANLNMFFTFYPTIWSNIRFRVNYDINNTSRSGFGRFTTIGCHVWAGDSSNNNISLNGPRTFPINGFTQRPTMLNQNGSFATITEAIDYINHYGVGGSGNVVLELQPGYNGETGHLPALIDYPGSNLGRPVIFKTQDNFSTTISVPNQSSMNNLSVLRFMGARWVSFNGGNNRGITFSMPALATNFNTRIISITPVDTASNNISIINCRLIGNSTTATVNTGMGIYVGNPNTTGLPLTALKTGISNINLVGNTIEAVRSGIEFHANGASLFNLIKSNIIGGNIPVGTAQNTTFIGGNANSVGIRVKGITNSVIDSNVVRNCIPTAALSNGFMGIVLEETGVPVFSDIEVARNFTYNLVTLTGTYTTGLRIFLNNTAGPRGIRLINNFVGRVIGNGTGLNFSNLNPAGIILDAAVANTNAGIALAHNTVFLNGVGLGNNNSGSAALFVSATIQGGVEICNNIFGNKLSRTSATGNRYAVLVGAPATPFTTNAILPFAANNNNYFATGNGNNFVGANNNGSINRININDWRAFTAATPALAGMDGNSFNWINTFKTDTTPDVNLLYGGLVPGGASFVTGICNDIYGNPRYQCTGGPTTTTRWVGAAEIGLPYPSLQGNTTYQINGIDNPPTPFSPNSGSFRTVRNAIDYLNSQGVDDPNFGGFRTIKLEIALGYVGETDTFMGPITVLDYPRQSNTRPVVLTVASGRNDTIRIVSNVNPAIAPNMSLFRLSGCRYFTIDGNNGTAGQRNLTLVLPANFTQTTNKVVDIISGVAPISSTTPFTSNNTVKNCNLVGNSTPTTIQTFAGVYMGGLNTPSNSVVGGNGQNTIENNFIGAVQNGIYIRSNGIEADMDNGNSVIGNTIGGTIAPATTGNTNYFGGSANAAGIIAFSQTNLLISNNTIRNSHPSFGAPRAIELGTILVQAPILSTQVRINGNTINNITTTVPGGAYGIFVNFLNNNANVSRNIVISNNMISGIAAPGTNASGANFANNPFGIYLNATSNIGTANTYVGLGIYYNSINLGSGNSLTSASALSACLGIPSFIRAGVLSQNNIFQNRLGGPASPNRVYAVAIGGTDNPFATSDYNNYFTSATAPSIAANFGVNASGATPVLHNQWFEIMSFTGQDTLSLTGLAPFTNDNNLFIPATTASNLFQAGRPMFQVLNDINGTPRNAFQSSIGAHEFDGTYLDNVAPRIFNAGDATACQSGPIVLDFNIYDKLLTADSLYYRINGGAVANLQASLSIGTFRRYIIPAQPSGTLIEYRVSAVDFPVPPNVGAFPAGKIWDTLSTGINTFPYFNGFEGVNNPAWTSQSISGGAMWEIGSNGSTSNPPLGARSGIRSALFRSSAYPTPGSTARLVSPCLDFSNAQSPTLRFYVSQNSDLANKQDSIEVKVSFGANIWSNALRSVRRVNPDFPLPGYTMVEVCLSAFKTSGLRIAIEAYGSGTGQNIQIDDITIYDDVQNQTISPKSFNQCFRDPIYVGLTNTDPRFLYEAVNLATNQILDTATGNGASLNLSFMTTAADTMRYVVVASNQNSRAINTGFGGGFITCRNTLPDTMVAVINRFYNGPFVTAGTPFQGSYNAGDANNPDGARVGDVITYQFVPPAFYTNASYGSGWSIPTINAFAEASGIPFTGFNFTPPSASGPGFIRFTTTANMLDSNIIFDFKVRINASGCDSSFRRVLRVAVAPTANFDFTPPAANLCAKNPINFNAVGSTLPSNNFPFSFTWLFGDGTFSNVQNPTKLYDSAGTYQVRFVLTDRYGLSSTKVETVTILPAPTINFTTNVPCANDSTVFTPNNQPAGSVYLWTMPNLTTQNRMVAKFNFGKFDTTYRVSLRVTNSSGCFNSETKNIYVFAKPTANFASTAHCLSNNVPITNTSTIPVGNMGYNWSWGNGQTSLSAAPQYKYPASGTFNATLIVSSAFGCTDSVTKTITVYDRPFVGFNAINPCFGQDDVTSFQNTTSFAGGGQNLNYFWNFGDLSTSNLQNPTNAYRGTGNYTVRLLAVDKLNGCRDSITRNISIFYKPVAQFATSPNESVCEKNLLQVINTSYSIDQTPLNCNWNWGDGNVDSICDVNHTYIAHALYKITLITKTAQGCSDTATKDISVTAVPNLDVTFADNDPENRFPIGKNRKLFTANLSDGESYRWSINDANKTVINNGSNTLDFTFSTKGKYWVVLSMKDVSGCTVTDSVEVEIGASVGVQDQLAAEFDLTAYPNPFNDNTSLSFDLPKSSTVNVVVMDMLGRVIDTKNLGNLSAGKHNEVLSNFGAAGTYLVKVDINGTVVYKQVIKQ